MTAIQGVASTPSFAGSVAATGSVSTPAAAPTGGADASQALSAPNALQQQMAGILSMVGDQNSTKALATLALALLLSKSDDSQDKQDPWKMLASLALLNGMMQGQQTIQFSAQWSVGGADASAAASSGATSAVGGSLNVQG